MCTDDVVRNILQGCEPSIKMIARNLVLRCRRNAFPSKQLAGLLIDPPGTTYAEEAMDIHPAMISVSALLCHIARIAVYESVDLQHNMPKHLNRQARFDEASQCNARILECSTCVPWTKD